VRYHDTLTFEMISVSSYDLFKSKGRTLGCVTDKTAIQLGNALGVTKNPHHAYEEEQQSE
jgi:hypothetical protein